MLPLSVVLAFESFVLRKNDFLFTGLVCSRCHLYVFCFHFPTYLDWYENGIPYYLKPITNNTCISYLTSFHQSIYGYLLKKFFFFKFTSLERMKYLSKFKMIALAHITITCFRSSWCQEPHNAQRFPNTIGFYWRNW